MRTTPADDAGVFAFGLPQVKDVWDICSRKRYAFRHICSAAKSIFCALKSGIFNSNEAMHLLPQSFVFQMAHSSSQGASDGITALLLPAVIRFFSKSLPHLLPRQAFSFKGQTGSSNSEIGRWCCRPV
jgi:hypothetical protein